MKPNLSIFLYGLCFGVKSKKLLPRFDLEDFLLFSPKFISLYI